VTARLALLLVLVAVPHAWAAGASRPAALRDVGFDQHVGAHLPLAVTFTDENGRAIRLGDYFGTTPVLLVPAYAHCPMLCPLVQSGVRSALRALALDVGKDFRVVSFSFDPAETVADAAARKAAALADYRRPGAEAGWHFLTGEPTAIRALTDAIGFRYAWDDASKQFAHASGVVVATPDGTIARYFFGVEFAPKDLRLALVEASAGRIGSIVDQLLLFCFHYDPETGRYTRVAMGAMQIGGAATVLALAAFVGVMLRRDARRGTA
jgi:protein SCO1/2